MEDPDGFVRTLSDSELPVAPAADSDDDSCLEFGSDRAEDDVAPSGRAAAAAGAAPFFTVSTPHAWNLRGARADAEELRPFQTSIDEKIKRARKLAPVAAVPEANGGEDPDNESQSRHGQGIEPDDGSEGGDGDVNDAMDPDEDSTGEDPPDVEVKKQAKKGKKRKRKEAEAEAATFESLNLSKPLLKVVASLDWTVPTPVQARAIPYILAGRDVCGSAVTGSGKTGAFVLPVLERLQRSGIDNATRVIILLPTRELAAQCHAVTLSLCKHTSIRAALAVGGLSNKAQEVALRARPHIIVATPGRLIDHVRNAHGFVMDDIEILVMDEADRLLEMGFKDEVEEIVRLMPASGRQTILFSATMSRKLESLIKLSLQNPVHIAVDPLFDVASTLTQEFIKLKPAQEQNKDAVLFALVTRSFTKRTIIFFRQKVAAHRFKILFGLCDLKCAELHGNLTQAQRLEALDLFREATVDFLLCTDLAARGLDITGVETVINYDMPMEVTEYVHRVGRTARAGATGRACGIVCTSSNDERKVLRMVAKRAQNKLSARVVQPAVLGKWRAWIDSHEQAVKAVLKEERQEKELRVAEMELEKADNLLKHSDEIYSRPARTWFQSSKQKLSSKDASRAQRGVAPRPGVGESKPSTKQGRALLEKERVKAKIKEERERSFSQQRARKSKVTKRRRVK